MVCDDSVALMPLIQINRALFSDDGDTAGRSGYDTDDGGSPAGPLGLHRNDNSATPAHR